MIKSLFLCLSAISFLTSCTFHRLDVQTQYLSHENLASYQVGTPDPQLYHPNIGQRLLIEWNLCSAEFKGQELNLFLKVRFRNLEEREICAPIRSMRGNYLYEIKNQEFLDSGGILTYIVEIQHNGSVLEEWKHPLWTELIRFK